MHGKNKAATAGDSPLGDTNIGGWGELRERD